MNFSFSDNCLRPPKVEHNFNMEEIEKKIKAQIGNYENGGVQHKVTYKVSDLFGNLIEASTIIEFVPHFLDDICAIKKTNHTKKHKSSTL